ncbi:MAG TPA: MFS transporter [Anaerolineaceae bacterium]|jgi:GPH family glycoside/pentoside/hexuronide:cation symporter|nr:MFS transporter [Anaerolineaceae bacterium]HPT23226.1 MFS transporter [Anaerolineaceae bacterium]
MTVLESELSGRQVSRSTRFFYGLAGMGSATVSGIYAALLTIFYQDYLGLPAHWIGIAFGVYAVWNAINDPIFGQITDRTRSKLGRRIPYMRFTAPFFAVTFSLVWFAPQHAPDVTKFIWMLVTMLLYDTCYTIIGLVHGALLPELTESDLERGRLSISASIFGLVGTLIGFIIPDFFRPKAGAVSTSLFSLQMSMVAVGIIAAFLIILTTYKVKEHREFSLVDEPIPLWQALKYTLTSKSFIIFVIMNFMCTFMFSICMGAIYYLADYVTRGSTLTLLAALFIPLAIGVPLTQLVMKRLEAVATMRVYLVLTAIGLISLGFLPAGLIPVGIGLVGFGYSGVQVVTYLLLGQVIDEDEIRTGVRREGSYLGANALITKPAQSLAGTLTASILAAARFVTRESNGGVIYLDQPASALFGIRSIVGIIPGVALLIAALALQWYPLKGQRLREIKHTILNMHADKKMRLDQMDAADPGLPGGEAA